MLSADELVSAVRVHLDRVHDAVRRLGCPPGPAAEVVRSSAEQVVEQAAAEELTVEQAVGRWFAGARAAGDRHTAGPGLPVGDAALSGDDDQSRISAALEALPDAERAALLLRDSYDLPSAVLATALGRDDDAALATVARARLAFLARYDDDLPLPGAAPAVPDHTELAALARLGESRPVASRDATARRHALSCAACRAVVDEQVRAHLLLTGLVVLALPDAARADVLATVERRARRLLPTSAPVVAERAVREAYDDPEPPRGLSPLLVVLSVVLAVLAGTGAGLLLSGRDEPPQLVGADGRLPPGVVLASPPPGPPSVLPSPPTVPETRPDTEVVVIPPPPPPRPSPPPPSPSPSPSPVVPVAAVTVTPGTGADGTTLTVAGTGFPAGAAVVVDYVGPAGPANRANTTAAADGTFSVQVLASDPVGGPGPHTVVATAGEVTATAAFTATG